MKLWHWLIVLVVGYEALVGLAEILSSGVTSSNPLAALVSLPSVGSLVQSGTGSSTAIAGGVDLGTAILLYFVVLHRHVIA